MTCKEKIIIDIEDNTRQYYLDEVTCFEKPFVVLLNDYKNKYGQYFLLLCKILRVYMYGKRGKSYSQLLMEKHIIFGLKIKRLSTHF